MLLLKVTTILFVVALTKATYEISKSKPRIQVFTHGGFSISIEDQPGISSVEFHVNLRKGTSNIQKEFLKIIQRPRNGRWIYSQRKVSVEIGDVLDYWVLIIHNHMGYRINGNSFIVEDLIDLKKKHIPYRRKPEPKPCKAEAASIPLQHCEKLIENTTHALMWLNVEVEALTKLNNQLTEALEKYPDAKQLTLSGRIPPDDDPAMIVAFILREKLDIEPEIVSAIRTKIDSITFNVATLSEKLDILEIAKYKLSESKIYIS